MSIWRLKFDSVAKYLINHEQLSAFRGLGEGAVASPDVTTSGGAGATTGGGAGATTSGGAGATTSGAVGAGAGAGGAGYAYGKHAQAVCDVAAGTKSAPGTEVYDLCTQD
ncbi:hypothetical protein PPROV_000378900 [Pycnococcus provasolii]|uniref:Uncharacterized protein n=1 Tax=Pycnococcus provasolii TaxID=41880 RepID=A0A830HJ18_9CHLO|nr:hypothetical protein PPROV_000378900 [Pycnococcus provasolii]